MQPVLILVAAAALGIDVGWQPLETGGVEYTIQIAPEEVDRLQTLDDLISDVPADLDVRRYRITVGKGKLPQIAPKPTEKSKEVELTSGSTDDTPKTYSIPAVVIDPDADVQQATANKPVTGSRDPSPEDEELLAAPRSRTLVEEPRQERLEPRKSDSLFNQPSSRSYRNEEPEDEKPALPLPKRPASRPQQRVELADDSEYQVQKAPTFPNSVRTASVAPLRERSSSTEQRDADEPWMPMLTSLFLLFMSMGANLYLGWIAWESRLRYRMLLDKFRAQGGKTTFEPI